MIRLKSYGCWIYLHIKRKGDIIKHDLVSAKSTVSLNEKPIYSPIRVNCCESVIKLFVCVYENLETFYNFDKICCWVDSSVVFAWSNNVSKIYKQCVQSHLIVRNLGKPQIWKYILLNRILMRVYLGVLKSKILLVQNYGLMVQTWNYWRSIYL